MRGGKYIMREKKSDRHPEVETARCTGCGRCVSACPERLFTLEVAGFRKHALLTEPARCSRCLVCLAACPVGALSSPATSPPTGKDED